MWAPGVFTCPVASDWIDYNGHLRDAYYGVIASLAVDALMDELGLDAAYRRATRCTLYTLESHFRFLAEIKAAATVRTETYILEHDPKRLRTRHALRTGAGAPLAAVAEFVLLHVQQAGSVRSMALPALALSRLAESAATPCPPELAALGSRAMTLLRRP